MGRVGPDITAYLQSGDNLLAVEVYRSASVTWSIGPTRVERIDANAWPLPAYRLDASQPMSFKYRLSPVDGDYTSKTKEPFEADP